MATEYGLDVSTLGGLDDSGRNISGKRSLAECIMRRWQTPAGSLPYAQTARSLDLRDVLSRAIDAGGEFQIARQMEIAAEEDERVSACRVALSWPSANRLKFTASVVPVEGQTFTFTGTADDAGLALLEFNAT